MVFIYQSLSFCSNFPHDSSSSKKTGPAANTCIQRIEMSFYPLHTFPAAQQLSPVCAQGLLATRIKGSRRGGGSLFAIIIKLVSFAGADQLCCLLKCSLISRSTTGDSRKTPIRLGTVMKPLKVSLMLQINPRSVVAPRMETRQ